MTILLALKLNIGLINLPIPFLVGIAGMMSCGLPFLKMRCLNNDCVIVKSREHALKNFQEIQIKTLI